MGGGLAFNEGFARGSYAGVGRQAATFVDLRFQLLRRPDQQYLGIALAGSLECAFDRIYWSMVASGGIEGDSDCL